jgi:hypothetical protein
LTDHGREIVRVDRRLGKLMTVPDDELQSKADRDYFISTTNLAQGRIYVSDVTLNQEHGILETPHVATLRVATPIFSDEGRLCGLVIINWDAAPLLRKLTAGQSNDVRVYLGNNRGDFALHPQAAKSFGLDLDHPWRWQAFCRQR